MRNVPASAASLPLNLTTQRSADFPYRA